MIVARVGAAKPCRVWHAGTANRGAIHQAWKQPTGLLVLSRQQSSSFTLRGR